MVLGLSSDPNKFIVTSKFKTFCNLCSRAIYKDEEVYTWKGSKFFVHTDCSKVTDRVTNFEFRKSAKKRPNKKMAGGIKKSRGRTYRDLYR